MTDVMFVWIVIHPTFGNLLGAWNADIWTKFDVIMDLKMDHGWSDEYIDDFLEFHKEQVK